MPDRLLTAEQGDRLIALIAGLPGAIAAAIVATDRQRVPHGPTRDALISLAREIAAANVGELPFSVRELLQHAALPESLKLRAAIDVIVQSSDASIAIGRALGTIERTVIGDVRVERVRKERGSWLWCVKGQ